MTRLPKLCKFLQKDQTAIWNRRRHRHRDRSVESSSAIFKRLGRFGRIYSMFSGTPRNSPALIVFRARCFGSLQREISMGTVVAKSMARPFRRSPDQTRAILVIRLLLAVLCLVAEAM
ncbi:hypothetical protein [Bradyrhizobium genosp. P]|uniref:hypothetical protein n=1 Tax=Bradyrhizobium genosp. P TaxID=83641 RepID=UPI003CEB84E0